ncbi:MAG: transposase [Thermoguttaceae bacterium]|nr:transposase [Thermoguttaceae bacterium]
MLSQSIPRLKRFAKSLRVHASGILAWFDYQIETGPLKGPNNKIMVIKRKAYGFRNIEYFKLKTLSCHIRRP